MRSPLSAFLSPQGLSALATCALLLLLFGCQSLPKHISSSDPDPDLLAEASLPDYVPGEYYVYDDGTSAVVTDVSDSQVTWKHHNESTSKGYPNFIIPPLSWDSADQSSEGRTSAPADFLWPLAEGRRGYFYFDQTISPKDGRAPEQILSNWACTVEGTTRVSVPAGSYDAVVIACERNSSDDQWLGTTRRFFFAPAIGHYVVREDRQLGVSVARRELVAYGFNSTLLPRRDQVSLNDVLRVALTKNRDGRASFWRSRSGTVSAMLIPLRSYTSANGRSCREYRSVYSIKGRMAHHTREVCRQPDGSWQRVD